MVVNVPGVLFSSIFSFFVHEVIQRFEQDWRESGRDVFGKVYHRSFQCTPFILAIYLEEAQLVSF